AGGGGMGVAGGGFALQQVGEGDDGPRAVAEVKALFPLTAPRTIDFMAMKITLSLAPGPIDEYVFKLGFETLPEHERDMMRRVYGDEGRPPLAAEGKPVFRAGGQEGGGRAEAPLRPRPP